jgi:hypothetical protein
VSCFQIVAIKFNPFIADEIVSVGEQHVQFWKLKDGSLTGQRGIVGRLGKIQAVLSLAFLPDGSAVTGTASGEIYKWKKGGSTIDQVITPNQVSAEIRFFFWYLH